MFENYVSLIGRTNVGKSSLFNMFLNDNISISTSCKNFTVDSKVACLCNSDENCFLLSDNAGIREFNDVDLFNKIKKNIFYYIKNSKLILFVISAIDGITFLDIEIAKILRTFNKKVFLIVNKSENFNFYTSNLDFYSLGFKDIFFTSSSNNIGIKDLLHNFIVPFLKKNNFFFSYKKCIGNFYFLKDLKVLKNFNKSFTTISVLGKQNVGKSTFINAIVNKNRLISNNYSGTTTDSIEVPFLYKKNKYIFIDTAGIKRCKDFSSKIEFLSIRKSVASIKNSDVILLIIDATKDISKLDFYIVNKIILFEKCFFILVNKWDLLSENKKISFKKKLKFFLDKIIYVDYFFISAKNKCNLFSIFTSINNIKRLLKKNYSSSILTKILKKVINRYKPPLFNKKRITLKYANLISKRPFRILIHGNRVEGIISSYKKYLINSFSKYLYLKNIPLKIFFKKNNNPYI
ncbi:ribosome biogenesis GTPase Der [Buchnera aphidicola (Astegopteryx bambusae)]|uniref:ribosome biogenesis GTPase Der n=1 Tax=Buchnera aphidicola TaxID=9 RepID=UPI0031B83FF1